MSTSRTLAGVVACVLVFLYAFMRYGDSVLDFFFLDDFWSLRGASNASLKETLAQFTQLGGARLYRPLTQQLYFTALMRAFGIDSSGYHLVHLSMFGLTCVFAVWMGRELTGTWVRALACGLLYASAPGHAAAVFWVSAFTMIGSAAVIFASIAWWLWDDGRRRVVVCCVLQAIGLFCSEHTIITPVLLFLASVLGPREERPRVALRKLVPLIGLVAVYGVGRLILHARIALPAPYTPQFEASVWLANLGRYSAATLNILSMAELGVGASTRLGIGILLALGVMAFLTLRGASWSRLPTLGLGMFVAALIPVLPLTRHYYDYYVGVAALGSAVALIGITQALPRYSSMVSLTVAALVVGGDLYSCDRAARSNRTVREIRAGQRLSALLVESLRATEQIVEPGREITIPRSPVTDYLVDGGRAEGVFMAHPERLTVLGGRKRAVRAEKPAQPAIRPDPGGEPFWWSQELAWARRLAYQAYSMYKSIQGRCQ
jgi:hypothetical protein